MSQFFAPLARAKAEEFDIWRREEREERSADRLSVLLCLVPRASASLYIVIIHAIAIAIVRAVPVVTALIARRSRRSFRARQGR